MDNLIIRGYLNILINAMQAITEKQQANGFDPGEVPEIIIRGERVDCHTTITIRDNGCGMDKETLSRIMEPFYTTKGTGVGLGMAVSDTYMKENNGSISYTSCLGAYTEATLLFTSEEDGSNEL